LQAQDPDGNGTTWYQVDDKQIYYLLSSELQGDHYLVTLSEQISPQNRNTWFVSKEDVKISNI
jgi:protein subunit release factor B